MFLFIIRFPTRVTYIFSAQKKVILRNRLFLPKLALHWQKTNFYIFFAHLEKEFISWFVVFKGSWKQVIKCVKMLILRFFIFTWVTYNGTSNLRYKKSATYIPVSFVIFQWSLLEESFSCILQRVALGLCFRCSRYSKKGVSKC